MTDEPTRPAAPRPRALLQRILEEPSLVRAVQSLEPRALGGLIAHVGLEDAGELVALATTAQLAQIFDEDLWRAARPGEDESFDAERFTQWLEVMLEAGEALTARKLTELPEDLVTLALQRNLLVLDLDALALEMSARGGGDDDALLEKALDGCLYQEIDRYRLIARRHDGWDAIVTVLLALDARHHDFLVRVLERCCHASTEHIEDNGGLYHVLSAADMLESDAAAEREERRARAGYVAPSAAASFLALARTTEVDETLRAPGRDPITRAYFRSWAPAAAARAAAEERARSAELAALLEAAEAREPRRAPPLLAAAATQADDETVLRRAMAELQQRDEATYLERMQELSYLGNVLVAGCSLRGERFRPLDAVQAVAAVCNLGLEHVSAARAEPAAAALAREGADRLFRVGWRRLHTDVALPALRALAEAIARARDRAADPARQRALDRAAAAVRSARAAGKPWTARRQLRALDGVLDAATRAALDALLDECPTLPRAPDAGAAPDAPPAWDFIATARQLRQARSLLPG